MQTKVININKNFGKDDIENLIRVNTVRIVSAANEGVIDYDRLNSLCLNICYRSIFLTGDHSKATYTVAEICENVPGLFSKSMFNLIDNLSNIGTQIDIVNSLKRVISDSFFYELLEMLNIEIVQTYAMLAFYYTVLTNKADAYSREVALSYMLAPSKAPTRDWQTLFNHFNGEVKL